MQTFLILFSFVFVALLAIMYFFFSPERYQKTKGTILTSEVLKNPRRGFRIHLVYEYHTPLGIRRSDRIAPLLPVAHQSKYNAVEKQSTYPAGKEVDVYYNQFGACLNPDYGLSFKQRFFVTFYLSLLGSFLIWFELL